MKRKNKANKRAISIFLIFCLLYSGCIIRIASIQNSSAAYVADMQFMRKISLCESRGYIYDVSLYFSLLNNGFSISGSVIC